MGGCNKSRSNSSSGSGWNSVARMSGVIRVKVFCDWVLGISVRSGALGLFCSVGRYLFFVGM